MKVGLNMDEQKAVRNFHTHSDVKWWWSDMEERLGLCILKENTRHYRWWQVIRQNHIAFSWPFNNRPHFLKDPVHLFAYSFVHFIASTSETCSWEMRPSWIQVSCWRRTAGSPWLLCDHLCLAQGGHSSLSLNGKHLFLLFTSYKECMRSVLPELAVQLSLSFQWDSNCSFRFYTWIFFGIHVKHSWRPRMILSSPPACLYL